MSRNRYRGNVTYLTYSYITERVSFPWCRAEHRRVWADLPDRGAAGKPRVFRKGWDALSKNPVQIRGAQGKSGMGRPFFWILFFGRPKKSIAVAGPRTGVKLSVAIAKQ